MTACWTGRRRSGTRPRVASGRGSQTTLSGDQETISNKLEEPSVLSIVPGFEITWPWARACPCTCCWPPCPLTGGPCTPCPGTCWEDICSLWPAPNPRSSWWSGTPWGDRRSPAWSPPWPGSSCDARSVEQDDWVTLLWSEVGVVWQGSMLWYSCGVEVVLPSAR